MGIHSLVLQGRRGVQAIEKGALGPVDAAGWRPVDPARVTEAWASEVESGLTVAMYHFEGSSKRSPATLFRSLKMRGELPIVARETLSGGPMIVEDLDLVNQTVINRELAEAVDQLEQKFLAARSHSDGPEALGLFLTPHTGGFWPTLRPLDIVTERGKIPLRLDGATRLARAGVQLLVKPSEGIVPSFQIVRAHPALVGIGTSQGITRSFHTTNRFAIDLRSLLEEGVL